MLRRASRTFFSTSASVTELPLLALNSAAIRRAISLTGPREITDIIVTVLLIEYRADLFDLQKISLLINPKVVMQSFRKNILLAFSFNVKLKDTCL